jgi:hypothetical protein
VTPLVFITWIYTIPVVVVVVGHETKNNFCFVIVDFGIYFHRIIVTANIFFRSPSPPTFSRSNLPHGCGERLSNKAHSSSITSNSLLLSIRARAMNTLEDMI